MTKLQWMLVFLIFATLPVSAAPQTRLCQPCGWEGCAVPGWDNAVCNGGVCRPACPPNFNFECPQFKRPGCYYKPGIRDCKYPERCP